MFTIAKSFTFEAAHALTQLPATHKCSRLHGHSYTVTLELHAVELSPAGFVLDFGDLTPFEQFIKERLDHRYLNDAVPNQALTTSEMLASWLFKVAADFFGPLVVAVRVSETPRTWAEYRP